MFAPWFHGHLEGFADALAATAPANAHTTSGRALAEADTLAERVACFCAEHGCHDVRAGASQWSKWFSSRLIIATTVVQLSTDRHLCCRWADIDLAWQADATPRCFALSPDCFIVGRGTDFAGLVDGLLCPLVTALAAYSGLSARVFWSNAAMYYAWVVSELGQQNRVPAERVAAAGALLDTRLRPDGGFNPFYRALRACRPGTRDGNGELIRQYRRICCVQDLDPRWGLCANCPRAVVAPPVAAGP